MALPNAPLPVPEPSAKSHTKFTVTSETYAHEIYRDTLAEDAVDDFLRSSDSFDVEEKRWTLMQPLAATENLVGAVCRIARSVLKRFVVPAKSGVERKVVNMAKTGRNDAVDENGYRLCPAIVVRASGPSFEDPPLANEQVEATPRQRQISFSNMASYLTVKLDAEVGTPEDILKEMEIYAKEIFAEQPNRMYVRCLLLTERHVRLLHFDRAGTQMTPPMDIHRHPLTFVRLIAGIATTDERLLGLDDSVQWTIVDGRKAAGTLTTTGPKGEAKAYPIIAHIPNPLESIRGRGTTCWRVRDPETSEELVVKDSWRPQERPAEQEFLMLVKGIPGVGQMVSFENGRGETKWYRCPSTAGRYHNRVAMRITMKSYGRSVEFFTSVAQFLGALRDAIAGHQRLVSDEGVRVLHRDISHSNILLGPAGALEGNRGVLIDLDMSFRATNEKPRVEADANVGTRMFQSLSVVSSFHSRDVPNPHDYLDDLESFFLVLVYILLTRRPDGTLLPSRSEGPSIVLKWDNPDPNIAYGEKVGIFGGTTDEFDAVRIIETNWGVTFLNLYKRFRSWASGMRRKKLIRLGEVEEDLYTYGVDEENENAVQNPFESLHSQRDEHYSQVLSFFDEAIEEAKASTATEAAHPPTTRPSVDGPTPSQTSTPVPAPTVAQPRRSARIRDARNAKGDTPPGLVATAAKVPAPPPHAPEPRRSARIVKRRLEEENQHGAPPSKSRKIKNGPRTAKRSW